MTMVSWAFLLEIMVYKCLWLLEIMVYKCLWLELETSKSQSNTIRSLEVAMDFEDWLHVPLFISSDHQWKKTASNSLANIILSGGQAFQIAMQIGICCNAPMIVYSSSNMMKLKVGNSKRTCVQCITLPSLKKLTKIYCWCFRNW